MYVKKKKKKSEKNNECVCVCVCVWIYIYMYIYMCVSVFLGGFYGFKVWKKGREEKSEMLPRSLLKWKRRRGIEERKKRKRGGKKNAKIYWANLTLLFKE